MAGDWIKFRTSLVRDGRIRKVSRSIPTNVTLVIGGLVTLWSLADEQADENGVLEGYTKDDINDLIGVENFCENLPDCWINIKGEFVQLPDYQQHNGATAKKRAQEKKRQRKRRESVTLDSNKSVTREEKRREENIYRPPTVDQVVAYFQEKGYSSDSARRAFDYYDSNDWKDSNGKQVKAWKQKMIAVWFKPENKITDDDPTAGAR